mgnify:CR=1 FL=1
MARRVPPCLFACFLFVCLFEASRFQYDTIVSFLFLFLFLFVCLFEASKFQYDTKGSSLFVCLFVLALTF